MGKTGYLILENSKVFKGVSFGSEKEVSGEVVFNTGMVGYPESFTDPSYYGQILTMTYPLIGNYGVPSQSRTNGLPDYLESERMKIRGLIVSTYIEDNNHWQSVSPLSTWLKQEGVPALSGIDTRTLTKILRKHGVMKGIITFNKPRRTAGNFYDINRENLIPFVSCRKVETYGKGKFRIVMMDTGLKTNQIRIFLKHDTTVIRVPWDYDPFAQNMKLDLLFVTNGPGDPKQIKETVNIVKEAMKRKIPVAGICLGHQILALAAGFDTYKLKYGHRGQNQPVKDELTGRCYITSQNHGFAVDKKSIPSNWMPWFTNLNDSTNEGVRHKSLPFFSTQFHPEAKPGPTDTEWIFEYFINEAGKWIAKR